MRGAIRIGVTQWSVDGRGPDTVRRAASLGFAAMHISSGELDGSLRLDGGALRDAYLEAARESGVTIDAIAGGDLNDVGMTSPAGSRNADRCRTTIQIAIDAAAEMGVPLVFLPSFRAGEIHDAADLRRTAAVLADACDHVAGRPVTIATENTLGADGNLELLQVADRPELRVLLDTQNPSLWGHPATAMIEPLWPHLADQAHVKDGRDGQMGNAILGDGDSDFLATATALRQRGFDGALISENDYHGPRIANAMRDIEVLAGVFGA
jgi:2-epi-5-epi-valiolone 7-phosphate 2-epimerase